MLPLRHNDFPDQEVARAAVLVGLVDRGDQDHLLLTERARHLRNHGGQVSFPGGRAEPDDDGLAHTALRELEEETGVSPSVVEVLGQLPGQVTISAFHVTPIVARIAGPQKLKLDPGEVGAAFEVPLEFFMGDERKTVKMRHVKGMIFEMPEWHFKQYRIWGATAWIIDGLIKVIKNNR